MPDTSPQPAIKPVLDDRLFLKTELMELECRLFAADHLWGEGDEKSANAAEVVIGDALQVVRCLRESLFPEAKPQGGYQP